MAAQSLNDLRDFCQFVSEKVNNGGVSLSPEEVLDEWRSLHPDPHTGAEDLAALQEAIDDLDKGDTGISFAEFDREFRVRRNLPPAS